MLPLIVLLAVAAGLLFKGALDNSFPVARTSHGVTAEPAQGPESEDFLARLRSLLPQRMSEEDRERSRQEAMSFMARVVVRLVPMTESSRMQDRNWLVYSGIKMPVSTFWALRVISIVLGAALGMYLSVQMNDLLQGTAALLLCLVVGSQLPTFYVLSARKRWRESIARELPDALDLMIVAVSAGSTFDVALRTVSERMHGVLGEAFADIMAESRYGSLNQALMQYARRSQVPSFQIFAASLAQADTTGAPLLTILGEQAATVREMNRLRLEQKANELTIKIMLPMIGLIFPVMIILLVAPLVPALMGVFAGL